MPDFTDLALAAIQVRERAHAPYSKYRVGAALTDETGRIHIGVNVENASYGATICAERAAILTMVSTGGRRVVSLVVATEDGGSPCGMCLQVLSEFAHAGETLPILLIEGRNGNKFHPTTFAELMPRPFALEPVPERADDPAR